MRAKDKDYIDNKVSAALGQKVQSDWWKEAYDEERRKNIGYKEAMKDMIGILADKL